MYCQPFWILELFIFFCFFCVSSEARFQRLSSSSSGQEDFENELVGIQGTVVFVARRAEGTGSLTVMIDGGLDSCPGSVTNNSSTVYECGPLWKELPSICTETWGLGRSWKEPVFKWSLTARLHSLQAERAVDPQGFASNLTVTHELLLSHTYGTCVRVNYWLSC